MNTEAGTTAPVRPRTRAGVLALLILLALAIGGLLWLPPIRQDPAYHAFADQRALAGIPNFWNVVSNIPFLAIAAAGAWILRRRPAFLQTWERNAHWLLVLGAAAIGLGSGYYHWTPDSATLVWDRLPMTLVFMSLFAITIGERIDLRAGRLLLGPLVAVGAISVVIWRLTGDLRLYAAVQFLPLLALPLLFLLCPALYVRQRGIWWMIALYTAAKLLELNDQALAPWLPGGGHPWKHLAAAVALLAYFASVARRRLPTPVAAPSSLPVLHGRRHDPACGA